MAKYRYKTLKPNAWCRDNQDVDQLSRISTLGMWRWKTEFRTYTGSIHGTWLQRPTWTLHCHFQNCFCQLTSPQAPQLVNSLVSSQMGSLQTIKFLLPDLCPVRGVGAHSWPWILDEVSPFAFSVNPNSKFFLSWSYLGSGIMAPTGEEVWAPSKSILGLKELAQI